MVARIPEQTLAEIRTRISIAEVVSAYVALRKAGRHYVGLCPFHSEKTPSFNVNEEGGFFHCFGCGVGGNVFTFLCRIDGISFPEAVRRLAAQAGVSLPQTENDPQARERAQLYRLNDLAATYFQRCLWGNGGGEARRYLTERGVSSEIAEQFQLGFAPPWGQGLTRFLSSQQTDLAKAATLGLLGQRENGRYHDKFRHRLMFPITDIVGRCIGFGGRLLPLSQNETPLDQSRRPLPKYLNSPESALYKKSAVLYGMSQAKGAIKQSGRALVVEGYMDLLALVQRGYAETVAISGTALTTKQLTLLRQFASEVDIFFDGDEAGRRAAVRAFPLCVEAELRGRGVFLPAAYDPDSFAQEHGQDQLDAVIQGAELLEDFYFAQHMPSPSATTVERVRAAKEAATVIQRMTDVVARGAVLTQVAQRFGVGEEELRHLATPRDKQVALRDKHRKTPTPPSERHLVSEGRFFAEAELIQLMLLDRHAAEYVSEQRLLPAFQRWGELAADIVQAWRQAEQPDIGGFLDRLPRQIADRVTQRYAQEGENGTEREQLLFDCTERLRGVQYRLGREQIQQAIREAEQRGDDVALRLSLQQLQEWNAAHAERNRKKWQGMV